MTKKDISIRDVYELIQDFREEIKEEYVSKNEFIPIKIIVYGMVGLILTGVMTALVANVVVALGA